MSISLIKAKSLIDELKAHEISLGRDPSTWYTYHNHVYGTAKIAQLIASEIPALDPNKLYILGLLHDICRTEDDRLQRFHGILGYKKLLSEDKEVARTCLLHTFLWNKIPPYDVCHQLFYENKEDYDFTVDFSIKNAPTDEDYLIQLCDRLANKNGFVTIEDRITELLERHRDIDAEQLLTETYEVKKYFDTKIGRNIYDFFKTI